MTIEKYLGIEPHVSFKKIAKELNISLSQAQLSFNIALVKHAYNAGNSGLLRLVSPTVCKRVDRRIRQAIKDAKRRSDEK